MTTARSAIQKGRLFQKKVLALIKAAFNLTEEDVRTPIGAENGTDIIYLNEQAAKTVGLSIEIKNQKNISIWQALKQAQSRPGIPALIFRRSVQGNSQDWIAVPLEHYLLIRSALRQREDIVQEEKIAG